MCYNNNMSNYTNRTKINSYDLQNELNRFIDEINQKNIIKLDKNNYKINNFDDWKTTNKIINHIDTQFYIKNREKAQKYLQKKKEELGEEEFNKQNAIKQKNYRDKQKTLEI